MQERHPTIPLYAAMLIFVAIGSGDAAEITGDAYFGYENYKTRPHYRAFAMTKMLGSVSRGWGWAWNHRTVENAIEAAMKKCEEGKRSYDTLHECKLHSIGNIVVYNMDEENIKTAIKLYKTNRKAINDDLTGFVPAETASSRAEQGDAEAQYTLGHNYQVGIGVKRDMSEALRWYLKAAQNGHSEAQYQNGFSYEKGRSVGKDLNVALGWYRKAAAQENARAQFKVGLFYEQGWAVRKDLDEALNWYQKAASQGHALAGMALGRLQTAAAVTEPTPEIEVEPEAPDVSERLRKVKQLFDEGLITELEAATKRKSILNEF